MSKNMQAQKHPTTTGRRCAGGAIAVAVLAGLVTLPATPATAAEPSTSASQTAERATQTDRATIESDLRYLPGRPIGIAGTGPANEWIKITGFPAKDGTTRTFGTLVRPDGVWSTTGGSVVATAPRYDVTVTPMRLGEKDLEPSGPTVSATLTADPEFTTIERDFTVTDGLNGRPGERAVLSGTANAFSPVLLRFERGVVGATADHRGMWSARSNHVLTRAEQVTITGNSNADGTGGTPLTVEVTVDGGGEDPVPITAPVVVTSDLTFLNGTPLRISGTASPGARIEVSATDAFDGDGLSGSVVASPTTGEFEYVSGRKIGTESLSSRLDVTIRQGDEETHHELRSLQEGVAFRPVAITSEQTFVRGMPTRITGVASPYALLSVWFGRFGAADLVRADAEGRWEITTSKLYLDNETVSVTQHFEDGGTVEFPFTRTDKVAPITVATKTFVTGQKQLIEGTAKPNARVDVYSGSKYLMHVIAGSDGKWSYTTGAAITDDTFTRTLKSLGADDVTFTLHAAPSQTPPITVATTSFVKGQKQLIEGTAAPRAKVNVYSGSKYLMNVTAGADGKWSYTTGAVIDSDTFIRTLKSAGTEDHTFTLTKETD
ncbi:hypothetical protein [Curtobacterium sp. GD1]|uniref:hypothetical protein n=1 Tax=Curtobacterium sp. GD1 TaxID=2810612 RepID=UPI001E39E344|nr:hypothetical protein [Curtobacterium sp. GD1]MCC8907779.1 hypothetical protein [Curtobacterium sp. GD1]